MMDDLRRALLLSFALILITMSYATLAAGEYKQWVDGKNIVETREAIPVGFYDISHYASMVARRLEAMREMKRMGVDYLAVPISTGDAATFDLAKQLGLGIKVEYNADMSSVLNLFRTHPQGFAHITGDDVDINFKDVESYRLVDAAYRRAAPGWLTLASNAYVKNANKFVGISDKTGQQSYPIPSEPVSATSYHFRIMSEAAAAKNTPFVAHVQTSKWAGKRYPTPDEVTTMSWTALAWGANEILYYTFYDYTSSRTDNTNLMTQPLIRGAVKTFISKLRQYEHYFLYGTRQTTQNSSGLTTVWNYPALKQRLTLTVNFNTKAVSLLESQIP